MFIFSTLTPLSAHAGTFVTVAVAAMQKWQPRQTPMGGVMPAARPAAAALPTPIPLEDAGPSYEDSVYTMTVRPMMPSDVGLRTRMDIIGYQMDTFGAANKDVLREYRIIERPGSRVKGGAILPSMFSPPPPLPHNPLRQLPCYICNPVGSDAH